MLYQILDLERLLGHDLNGLDDGALRSFFLVVHGHYKVSVTGGIDQMEAFFHLEFAVFEPVSGLFKSEYSETVDFFGVSGADSLFDFAILAIRSDDDIIYNFCHVYRLPCIWCYIGISDTDNVIP